MIRVALFGGSFDPPHLGHVLCAVYAHLVGRLDGIWVLPSARHPYGKALAPFDRRLELCRLAFAGLSFVEVRADERGNTGGFTIDLVESLARLHPDVRWCLVGGTDTRQDMPNWHRGDDLARLVEVVEVPRRGFDDAHPAALPAISSTLVRERLAAGADIADLVPAAVAERLAATGWYGPAKA